MKHKLGLIVTFTLVLYVSSALGEIIFVPGGVQYNPVPIPTRDVSLVFFLKSGKAGRFRIHTKGLNGLMKLDCSKVPGCQTAEISCADIPVSQQLELDIDRETGNVEGRTRGQLGLAEEFDFAAKVRGDATCLPFGNRACGQLVVDLEVQGIFTHPGDTSRIGSMRKKMVGSLVRDGESAQWVALSADITLGFALPDDVAELLSAKCM